MNIEFFDASLVCAKLEMRIKKMSEYMQMKHDEQDWKAVSDIANEIREVEAELAVWQKFKKTGDLLA